MIYLCPDTALAEPEVYGRTLCAHHKAVQPPLGRWRSIVFDELEASPGSTLRGVDSLIVVGLNRAMTPSNRTAEVFEVLFNQTDELHKVSVDRLPFVGEPWRSWFHFGLVGAPYRDYTYSYLAESDWRAVRNGIRDGDPFSLDEISHWGDGVIRSTHSSWFGEIDCQEFPVDAATKARYQEELEEAFATRRSIEGVIQQLAAFARSACDERSIPSPVRFFRQRIRRLVGTSLPVDRWLMAELADWARTTDGVLERFS